MIDELVRYDDWLLVACFVDLALMWLAIFCLSLGLFMQLEES